MLLAFLFAGVVAELAYRFGVLTRTGAIAAFAVGFAVFAAMGYAGAAVLFAFFVPSALLSRLGRARKSALRDVGKHGPRDAWQVLANGGVAAASALLAQHFGLPLAAAFAGAFAAAAADTWGTEIGTLSRSVPRSIVSLRPMATGLSGGVTLAGSAATIGGALLVAFVAAVASLAPFWAVAAGGVAGALADSLLGAGVQALRWCPHCSRECETDPHYCGTPTVLRRGFGWLENDTVNFAATCCGAIVAAVLTG